jgi:hypothetical protein
MRHKKRKNFSHGKENISTKVGSAQIAALQGKWEKRRPIPNLTAYTRALKEA